MENEGNHFTGKRDGFFGELKGDLCFQAINIELYSKCSSEGKTGFRLLILLNKRDIQLIAYDLYF